MTAESVNLTELVAEAEKRINKKIEVHIDFFPKEDPPWYLFTVKTGKTSSEVKSVIPDGQLSEKDFCKALDELCKRFEKKVVDKIHAMIDLCRAKRNYPQYVIVGEKQFRQLCVEVEKDFNNIDFLNFPDQVCNLMVATVTANDCLKVV